VLVALYSYKDYIKDEMDRICSTDKYRSHADRILFYKLSKKSAPTACKLMSDPVTITGHRATLGKMSHNFLSKLTHETNVNTTGCLPLPEHYFYKQSAQPMEKFPIAFQKPTP